MGLKKLNIEEITESNHQTKDDNLYYLQKLEANIRKNGQLQTIVVQKKKDKYKVVDGHMVFQALKNLDFKEVYCFVVDEDTNADLLSIEMNISFDMDFVRMAKKLKRLLEKLTPEDIEATTHMVKDEIKKFPRVDEFDFGKYDNEMHNELFLRPNNEYF